jgi:SAM-dependent methyltransferase
MDTKSIDRAISAAEECFTGADREFFLRVWRTDPARYRNRLRLIGFENLESVLDAGCGMGQWTAGLAHLNRKVAAIDYSADRVNGTATILSRLGMDNVTVERQSIEQLSFPDESFDAVFCYSVLMFADPARALNEFHRVLKKGGRLYICANGLGWYVYNIIEPHNVSPHYDPRKMAVDTLSNSLSFYGEGIRTPGIQVVIPTSYLRKLLGDLEFRDVEIGPEGTIALVPRVAAESFYAHHTFLEEGVYEVVAFKS